jgi:phosphonate transport system permease protein
MAVDEKSQWQRFDRKQRWGRYLATLTVLLLAVLFWHGMEVSVSYLPDAPGHLYDLFSRMFPPDLSTLPDLVEPTIETLHMSILATGFSVVISIPVAILAAENLSPNRFTYALGKVIISVARSVHDIIWALIFVVILGPGALAGMLALGTKSLGFIGKFFAEEIEEIDSNPVDAITATGADRLKVMLYAIVPQIKAPFLGISVYRWDVNVRGATIVGLVGAGGIGIELNNAMGYLYWQQAMTVLMVIFGLVIVSEGVSAYFRDKVR